MQRSIPPQMRRCQYTTGTQRSRSYPVVQTLLQGTVRRRHLVREESYPESDRADGKHQGILLTSTDNVD